MLLSAWAQLTQVNITCKFLVKISAILGYKDRQKKRHVQLKMIMLLVSTSIVEA